MMLLDDSGSMAWNYLPDWATTSNNAAFDNNAYNGVAYSAAVTYSPPVYFNSDGTVNTTTYPSMTSANTSSWSLVPNDGYKVQSTSKSNLVGNASFYTFVPGEYCDKANLRNCVLQTAASASYPYAATLRWCTTDAMSDCHAVRIETGTTYLIPRSPPLAATATITVKNTNSITITVSSPSGTATSTSVSGITASGTQIMKAATTGSTSTTTVAGYIVTSINNCMADTTVCNPGGALDYVASSSGSVVTVTGNNIAGTTVSVSTASGSSNPLKFAVAYVGTTSTTVSAVTVPSYTRLDATTTSSNNLLSGGSISTSAGTTAGSTNVNTVASQIAANINICHTTATCDDGYTATANNNVVTITAPLGITVTPTVTKSGSITFVATAFNGGTSGANLLTNIVSGTTSYPYPGTTAKAIDAHGLRRHHLYLHRGNDQLRQLVGLLPDAHADDEVLHQPLLPERRFELPRGLRLHDNNQGSAFVNPAPFTATNKLAWYNKFFAAKPNNSTPLRDFVAEIGQFYAGKYDGKSFNGVAVTDPMQYSCQQNFSIVATDGYWNETTNPNQIDGSTDIGDQDSGEARPYNDGGGVIVTKVTPTVTTTTVTTTGRTTLDRSTRTDTPPARPPRPAPIPTPKRRSPALAAVRAAAELSKRATPARSRKP